MVILPYLSGFTYNKNRQVSKTWRLSASSLNVNSLPIDQWQEEFMADQQLDRRAGGGGLAVSDTQRDDMFTWLLGVGGQRGAGA